MEPEGSDVGFKTNLINLLFEKVNEEVAEKDDIQDLIVELVTDLLNTGHQQALYSKIEKLDLQLTLLDMLERTADSVSDTADCSI
jgi:hypothetical protein